jgi:hypothetical protein
MITADELTYDSALIPAYALGAADIVRRHAPLALLSQVTRARAVAKEQFLINRYDDLIVAFNGISHRFEVAMRRLEGKSTNVDPQQTLDGADIRSTTLIQARAIVMDGLKNELALNEMYHRAFRQAIDDAKTHQFTGELPDTLLLEIHERELAIIRIRSAIEAFS